MHSFHRTPAHAPLPSKHPARSLLRRTLKIHPPRPLPHHDASAWITLAATSDTKHARTHAHTARPPAHVLEAGASATAGPGRISVAFACFSRRRVSSRHR
ncbi:hypothetical protein DENSPDRAFT_842570 [Dentipellis sp. KUC8613]|nr:hypothetical protein DENSPDRAFT_842570 [Dentipellis sp. KUC8613]